MNRFCCDGRTIMRKRVAMLLGTTSHALQVWCGGRTCTAQHQPLPGCSTTVLQEECLHGVKAGGIGLVSRSVRPGG